MIETAADKVHRACTALQTTQVDTFDLINDLFPDEASLSLLDQCVSLIDEKLNHLDKAIREELRSRAIKHPQDGTEWKVVKQSVFELAEHVAATAAKVTETRQSTHAIAKDIYALEEGKRNVIAVIASLQRLTMLQTAIQDLSESAAAASYGKCAALVQACQSLRKYFEADEVFQIPEIAAILKSLDTLFRDLKKQVVEEIESLLEEGSLASAENAATCQECCLAADALCDSIRSDLFLKTSLKILETYKRKFTFVSSATQKEKRKTEAIEALDSFDRRSAWLKKCLVDTSLEFSRLLPKSWRIEPYICQQFSLITRQQIVAILEVCSDVLDSKLLLKLMSEVRALEDYLSLVVSNIPACPAQQSLLGEDEKASLLRHLDSTSLSQDEWMINPHKPSTPALQPKQEFHRSISRVFDSFLGSWYMEQETMLKTTISQYMATPDEIIDLTDDQSLPKRLFASAIDLFRKLRTVHEEAAASDSPQMHKDVISLSKKAVSNYVVMLETSRRAPQLLTLINSSKSATTLRKFCLNILKLPREFLAPPKDEELTAAQRGTLWITTLMKDRKFRSIAGQELKELPDLFAAIATLEFVEETLPTFESVLLRAVESVGQSGLSFETEKVQVWTLRGHLIYLALVHFNAMILQKELLMPCLETCKTTQAVDSVNYYIKSFADAWQEWIECSAQSLSGAMFQYVFDLTAMLTAAQLIESIGVDCNETLTVQGTDQMRLNLSHIIQHMDKMHKHLQVVFAKRQLEPLVILLKLLGAFLTSREREQETADLESHLPSPSSSSNEAQQQDAYRSIWGSYLESSGAAATLQVEVIHHVLEAGGSSFVRLLSAT